MPALNRRKFNIVENMRNEFERFLSDAERLEVVSMLSAIEEHGMRVVDGKLVSTRSQDEMYKRKLQSVKNAIRNSLTPEDRKHLAREMYEQFVAGKPLP